MEVFRIINDIREERIFLRDTEKLLDVLSGQDLKDLHNARYKAVKKIKKLLDDIDTIIFMEVGRDAISR